MRKKKRINVRKHKRRLKSGNATIVRKHKRQLKTVKVWSHNDPENKILPDAEWYRQNTGEDFYNYLYNNNDKKMFYLEQCFPLKNDPHLPNGVLCSIVTWPYFFNDKAKNKLMLKRCGTDKEGYISCVHTAITDISLEDLPKDLTELYGLSHGEQMKLSPIEHFRALRSWAGSITEYGLENAILDSLTDLDMPFGFDWQLQRQFLDAMRKTYGDVGVLLAVDVLNNIYNSLDGDFDWSNQRFELLEHYIFGCGADPEMLDKCCQLFPDHIDDIKAIISWDECTSSEILEKLFQEGKIELDHLALNPNTPIYILEKLYQPEGDNIINNNLAENPRTPLHILEKLYKHDISDTDYWLAKNPSTPLYILEKFYINNHVNYGLVQNPNIPLYILENLSHDNDDELRSLVAENPSTPLHILEQLCFDKNSVIREYAELNILNKK